jgi:hypothetical protein
VIPPKAKNFKVRFPFIVITRETRSEKNEEQDAAPGGLYEVTAIRLALGPARSFLISVNNDQGDEDDPLLPIPAAVYTGSKHNRPKKLEDEVKPRFEVVPAQPNLHVSFSTSHTAIEDGTTVPVHLSDGENFTIPSFRLQNDFGPSGLGLMERLQIIGVGMPGIPDEMLFDTDAAAAALEEEDDDDDSAEEEEDAFEQLMEEDGLPPLKMKAQCEFFLSRASTTKVLVKEVALPFRLLPPTIWGTNWPMVATFAFDSAIVVSLPTLRLKFGANAKSLYVLSVSRVHEFHLSRFDLT